MRGDKCDGVEAAVTLADAAVNYGLSMRESGASLFLLGERTNKITTLANVMCIYSCAADESRAVSYGGCFLDTLRG